MEYFMSIWSILCPFGILYGHLYILRPFEIFYGYLVYLSCFGMLYQEKSGNPALQSVGNSKTSLSAIYLH
jgi:hypothetical protein